MMHPQAYLDALRLAPTEESEIDFRKRIEVPSSKVAYWRARTPGFKQEEERARTRRIALAAAVQKAAGTKREAEFQQAERAQVAAAARGAQAVAALEPDFDPEEIISPEFQAFLDALRVHDDRKMALDEAGIEWIDVQTYAQKNPTFKARYMAILSSQLVQVEDAVRRKGAKGDVKAAEIYLRATDPNKYSTKVDLRHSGTVDVTASDAAAQLSWLQTFRQGALPANIIAGQVLAAGDDSQAKE